MQVACSMLLLAAQALWVKSSENDTHGVQVQELKNLDVDYRDFKDTGDLVTDASRKTSSHVQNHNVTTERNGKNSSDNNMDVFSLQHDVFPVNNLTYELREDCEGDLDCSGESYRWLNVDRQNEILQVLLFLVAVTVVCLIILFALKLKLFLMRSSSWGYSPALMEDRGYELRVYLTTPTRSSHATGF